MNMTKKDSLNAFNAVIEQSQGTQSNNQEAARPPASICVTPREPHLDEESAPKLFDKSICLSNIRELLKTSDLKIGQLEKEAGCQPGYVSRLEKAGNTSFPSIDFLMTASKLLHVSLDILLTMRIDELPSTAAYLVKFLDKLNKDTVDCKLDWERKTATSLNSMDSDRNGYVEHPLFVDTRFDESGFFHSDLGPGVVFDSYYYGVDSMIAGDCYSLALRKDAVLYLMQVGARTDGAKGKSSSEKEVWICVNNTRQFLTGSRDNSGIEKLVDNLFATVANSMRHPKLKKAVKSVLDAFLNDEIENEPEDSLADVFSNNDCPF